MKKIFTVPSLLVLLALVLAACSQNSAPPPPKPGFSAWDDHPISQMSNQGKVASEVLVLGVDSLPAPYSYGNGILTVSGYIYRIGTDSGKLSVTMPDQTTWSDSDMYTTTTPSFQGRLDGYFNFSVKLSQEGVLQLVIYTP